MRACRTPLRCNPSGRPGCRRAWRRDNDSIAAGRPQGRPQLFYRPIRHRRPSIASTRVRRIAIQWIASEFAKAGLKAPTWADSYLCSPCR